MINNAIALYSVDAEQAVLGCLMLNTDHDRTNAVFALLKPETFYINAHQVIYREIKGLFQADKPTDLITLTELMESKGLYERVGDSHTAEMSKAAIPASMVNYAKIVREKPFFVMPWKS